HDARGRKRARGVPHDRPRRAAGTVGHRQYSWIADDAVDCPRRDRGRARRLARAVSCRRAARPARRSDDTDSPRAGGVDRGEGARTRVGSPAELFRHPRWRRHTLVGLMLGVSGMIGLWGIGFYSPELISTALAGASQASIDVVRAWGTAIQDLGAFAGMLVFTI